MAKKTGAKRTYSFGSGRAEGNRNMKELLGGKGAGLAEMSNIGIPVPPGFTITTEVCTAFYRGERSCRGTSARQSPRRWPGSRRRPGSASATPPTPCSSRSDRAPGSPCPA